MVNIRKIYFVGIKGVGMASLAVIAKQAGFEVGGSDLEEEFITDSTLKSEYIIPAIGFNVLPFKVFVGSSKKEEILVITTAAHGGFDNPVTSYASKNGYKVLTHGHAVGHFMSGKLFNRSDIQGISVSGSHGKTTTSAMVATAFSELGWDPSYTVGTSELFPLGVPGHYGKGKFFIAEADEYTSEIKHEKKPKFLYQYPYISIINNIDYDHPDFYSSIAAVEKAFESFMGNIKPGGLLIINGDDNKLRNISDSFRNKVRIVTYGEDKSNNYILDNFEPDGLNSNFTISLQDGTTYEFEISIPGFHNAKNAAGVISLLFELGINYSIIKRVMQVFKGSKRRFETIGKTKKGLMLIDDYAHHPKEIFETLRTVRNLFKDKKIVCVFQPHTFSRTKALLKDFATSFNDCDYIVLMPIFASAREQFKKEQEEEVIEEMKKAYSNLTFIRKQPDVVKYVIERFNSDNHIVITMGAGDVYKIGQSLIA